MRAMDCQKEEASAFFPQSAKCYLVRVYHRIIYYCDVINNSVDLFLDDIDSLTPSS